MRAQIPDGRHARGAEHGVMRERLRMIEPARAAREHLGDARRHHHRGERRIASRDALAEYQYIGHDATRLQRRPGACPPRADQHLVGDEPPTGSAMNAATVSRSSRMIASSSAAPLQAGQYGGTPPHAQRYAYGAGM